VEVVAPSIPDSSIRAGTNDARPSCAPASDRSARVGSQTQSGAWIGAGEERPRALRVGAGKGPFLDVGAGTGDLTLALMRASPRARVLGLDIARAMPQRGRAKGASMAQGSGLLVPARDATFEGVTNAFVLRNLADLDAFFAEARRVLKPDGKLVSLEIARPRGRLFGPPLRLLLLPDHARAWAASLGRRGRVRLSRRLRQAHRGARAARRAHAPRGFRDVRARPLMRGAVVLFEATK